MSDLEYRIRQHSDIHRQIRQKKGEVRLLQPLPASADVTVTTTSSNAVIPNGEAEAPASAATTLSCDVASSSKQDDCITTNTLTTTTLNTTTSHATNSTSSAAQTSSNKTSDTSSTPLLNGIVTSSAATHDKVQSIATNSNNCCDSDSELASCVAARCRALMLGKYRKRKLLRTVQLYARNKKCARLSTVKCQCYPPLTPCAMCGGRYNNTREVDQEAGDTPENIALLDHSYHQVLSTQEGKYLHSHGHPLPPPSPGFWSYPTLPS